MKATVTVSLEIKSLGEREFDGHGSVFKNVDLGGDIVLPGAFKRSLAAHKKADSLPQMFWMHDPSRVPGKWLDMHEDSKGLSVRGVLANTELGNEIHTLLKMDAVRGLSIGYIPKDQDFDDDGNRLIKEAELWEVSVVSMPMNPLAQIAHVKSRLSADGAYVPTPREFEDGLRRMGCSKQTARKLIAKIFDDSTGAMLVDSDEVTNLERRDFSGATLEESAKAGGTLVEVDEEAEAIAALNAIAEANYADKISRAAARGFK